MKKLRAHLLVFSVLCVVLLTGAHAPLRNLLIDFRHGLFPRDATADVVVVAIDAPSIEKVGAWPWPRSLHGELLAKLREAGVRNIAFDVDFSTRSSEAVDKIFADALRAAHGSVVLPAFKQWSVDNAGHQHLHINRPIASLNDDAWTALVNVHADPDGVVRRYPMGDVIDGEFIPSMAVMLAGTSPGKGQGPFFIDFAIRSDSIPKVSYADVLNGKPSTMELLRNKRAIIGGTALELGDRLTVPGGRVLSGPFLQALAAESIIQGRALMPAPAAVEFSIVAALCVLMAVAWRLIPVSACVLLLVGTAVLTESVATIIQAKIPIIVDTSLFHVSIVGYLAVTAMDELDFRKMLSKMADDRFQRIAMSLGDGLICTDASGRVTVWNSGAAAIFGYPSEEVVGAPIGNFLVSEEGGAFSYQGIAKSDLRAPCGLTMEINGKRKNGLVFPAEACLSVWNSTEGLNYGIVLRDISVRKREADKIRNLAEHDTLTGLANRHSFSTKLTLELEALAGHQGKLAVLFLDLDAFKQINDTLGHTCGDQVLIEVANQLGNLVPSDALIARLGGDEFAVVLVGDNVERAADELSKRILVAFDQGSIAVAHRQIRVKGSIGVAIYPDHGTSVEQLLSNADLALYRAKASGRSRSVIFDRLIRDEFESRLTLEGELRRAFEKNEFELFYQPQVSLRDGRVVGAEALIRWRNPDRGLLLPATFMSVVNNSPIATDVALSVLTRACLQGRDWERKGYPVRLAVNLCAALLQTADLPGTIEDILSETGFQPSLLELEVTEDIVLRDEQVALDTFRRIQELGVRIAFDDFGTGYGSLIYLKKFPLNVLKIDRSFVLELRSKRDDAAIVSATLGLAKEFNLTVIAEGIEDRDTATLLAEMGCEEGQGYYFGRPMPAIEFEEQFLRYPKFRSLLGQTATAA